MTNDLIELPRYDPRPLPSKRDIAAIVFRQRRAVIATFVGVIVLVLLSGMWMRKYEAHMKILALRKRTDPVVTPGANMPTEENSAITEEDLNSEVELLRSDDLLRRVVLSTGLQHRSFMLFGHADENTAIARAVNKLAKDLDVEPIRKTNMIEVKYRATDPKVAADVLNAVSTAYLEKHREVHHSPGELKFFDQQTAQLRSDLEQAETKLSEFTQTNGVVSAPLERDLTLQRLAEFDASAHQSQAEIAETTQRIRTLQLQLSKMQPRLTTAVKTGENPQLMQQLKATLLNLQLKRTELLTKYDPGYRLVKEVDQQIADTSAAIVTEQNQPPKEETTERDPTYEMLRSELAKAQGELSGLDAKATASGEVANEYRQQAKKLEKEGIVQDDLQRDEKAQEDNYLLYMKKREEARISDALDQRGILNVAVAEQPSVPVFPVQSPLKTGGIALLLAMLLSLGAAFVSDYADPSFRTPAEVAGYLDLPVLASLPSGKG